MNALTNWPHKWFGVWAEYGEAYVNCPSVRDFIDVDKSNAYPKDRISTYLRSCPIVATTSRINFPDPITGGRSEGAISYRTDGRWLWLDDLPDYIEQYGVCIPDEWFQDMIAKDFASPRQVSEDVLGDLEWPPV